jgi:hypothetical protein
MRLVDMKLTAEDKRREEKEMQAGGEPDDYPWELRFTLDGDELDKLGMSGLPKVGEIMDLQAKVKVVGVYASDNATMGSNRSINLQITALGLEPETTGKSAAQTLYGGGGASS